MSNQMIRYINFESILTLERVFKLENLTTSWEIHRKFYDFFFQAISQIIRIITTEKIQHLRLIFNRQNKFTSDTQNPYGFLFLEFI